MSDRISGQLTDLESRLVQSSRIAVDTAPIPNPILPPPNTSVLEGIRHSSLYLADGNLVMAAPISEAGGGTMLFRVHKSMLSLQSPVFASMFTLPHPEMNPDIYDGAPFVRMPDDAKDIESLLKVLYDPSELPYKRLDPLTPITVRRPLTMAIKYEMEPLRDRIIAQLQADWPNSLAEWDRLETEAHALWIEHASAAATDFKIASLSLDDRLPEPAAAIRLAADCNIPKIMPAAVYHLSRLETDQDWLESHKETSDANYDCNRTARWDLLEAADLKLVLKLRETIKDFQFKGLYVSAGKSCLALERCVDVWGEHCLRWAHEADPLSLMKSFREARPARGICKSCWLKTRDNVRDARVDLWEEICECIGDA
ncbi:hypothetical protein C8R46DRAFT_887153 [Mycena filopes]|nr:hypothetical protein C8R46DRAFT_887153 [Mycena filopes]